MFFTRQTIEKLMFFTCFPFRRSQLGHGFPQLSETNGKLERSLPANLVNDRRVANAVTLKSTIRLP